MLLELGNNIVYRRFLKKQQLELRAIYKAHLKVIIKGKILINNSKYFVNT